MSHKAKNEEMVPIVPTLVARQRLDSKKGEFLAEVPSIRLTPDQIEEIHADEYTLTLFYATRIEALSLADIKQKFPEPSPKKAQSIIERFISVGLIHLNSDGKYFSNYPENYINYSDYRYDADLETRKDSKIFQLMKDFTGKREYWKDKTYFSIDAFFTPEQSRELMEMFTAIKRKAKEFANQNAKAKTLRCLRFRRLKFYDMMFCAALAMSVMFGSIEQSHALGGNDPTGVSFVVAEPTVIRSGGNDPTARAQGCLSESDVKVLDSLIPDEGGGGYDPGGKTPKPKPQPDGGGGHDPGTTSTPVNLENACSLQTLVRFVGTCKGMQNQFCSDVRSQAIQLWSKVKGNDI